MTYSAVILVKQVRLHASACYPRGLPCTLTGQRESPEFSTSLTKQNKFPLNCRLERERPANEGGARGDEGGSNGRTRARAALWHTPAHPSSATTPTTIPRPHSRHGPQRTKPRRQLLRPAWRSLRGPRQGPLSAQGSEAARGARSRAEHALRSPPQERPRPPQTAPNVSPTSPRRPLNGSQRPRRAPPRHSGTGDAAPSLTPGALTASQRRS